MAIQIRPDLCTSVEVDHAILSQCDWKTVGICSSVCKLWDRITSDDKLIYAVLPESLKSHFCLDVFLKKDLGIKSHIVCSGEEIIDRFRKMLSNVYAFQKFSFKCLFPFEPLDHMFVKFCHEDKEVVEYDDQEIDYCIIVKPLSNGCEKYWNNVNGPMLYITTDDDGEIVLRSHGTMYLDYSFKNTPWEFCNSFTTEIMRIYQERGYKGVEF